ncbi:hypothetical protein [Halodesulfurarchaeum sp.]|uniref:hypothetical protein n=1 Tax=Halodesulfurarchaeum sp. TaxID=1980530 RepID=UPI001BC30477|nr:hypothetical protein [Halodesulfurarchaeum sp.]
MNSSHYSKIALVAVLLAVVAAGPAAAVSVSGAEVPDDAAIGSTVDVTYTVEELYTNYDQWQLEGETALESVTWTVTSYEVGDTQINQQEYNGQTFSHTIAKADEVAEVTVRLQGTVPEWDDWSYEPPQSVTLANFSETQEGGAETELQTSEIRPYNEESQTARDAIEEAQAAIDEADAAGVNVEEATSRLDNAISAYDAGNFENAQDLAEDSLNAAESAQQSSQQTSMLLLIGGVIVVIAILAGLVYWYFSNRETYDKLG